MLEREAAGEFPPGLSIGIATLPDMPTEQQRAIAEQLVQKFPTCPAGWAMHANFIKDANPCLDAIERGLATRPDADTRGTLLIRKAFVLEQAGEINRALEILTALTDVRDSISTQANAYVALAIVRGRHPDAN